MMRKSVLLFSLVSSLWAGQALAQTQTLAQTPIVALTGGTVVNIDGGAPIRDAVVVIADGRVQAVGPRAQVTVPPEARRIDMSGQWLLPGLMNTHVHLGLNLPGADYRADESDTDQVLRMAQNARLSLLSGVTTVRLVGEVHGNDFALKRAIEAGEVPGPRIETAGEVIVPTGGHGDLEADGPYALAKAVRQQIKAGATWIKIAISGGISDSHGAISAAPFTDEEIASIVEVAHRNGVRVTAHNGSSEAAKQAFKYGIDGFEHGYHLTADDLKTMKAKGMWLVPTIVVSQSGALEFYKKIGSPAWYLDRVDSVGKDHWAMLQNAIRIGVPISLGTDQYPFEPNSGTTATIEEAELYVKAGMTPLQALQSATTQSAKMLEHDKDLGRIAVGYYADIVAVRGDPTTDIAALRTLDFVMKNGEIVRDDRMKP